MNKLLFEIEENFSREAFNKNFLISFLIVCAILCPIYIIGYLMNPEEIQSVLLWLIAIPVGMIILYGMSLFILHEQLATYSFFDDHFEIHKGAFYFPYPYIAYYEDIEEIRITKKLPFLMWFNNRYRKYVMNLFSTDKNIEIIMIKLSTNRRINYRGEINRWSDINEKAPGKKKWVYYRQVIIPRIGIADNPNIWKLFRSNNITLA